MHIDEHIQRLEEKLQLLLKEYHQRQKEVIRLEKTVAELREEHEMHKKSIAELSQTVDVLKIKNLASDEGSKKELEKRINIYLREIDKCLLLLQS